MILIVFANIATTQFGDNMAKKEGQRAETESKRQAYLASRKAAKLASTTTTTEKSMASTMEQEG